MAELPDCRGPVRHRNCREMGERCPIIIGIGLRLVISTPERTRMMVESAYDETRATARLPNLDIELLHRRPWEGNEEHLVVMLRAVPAFEAVGRWLEVSNPLLVWGLDANAGSGMVAVGARSHHGTLPGL